MFSTSVFRVAALFTIAFVFGCSGLDPRLFNDQQPANLQDVQYFLSTLEFQLVAEIVLDKTIGSLTQAFSIGRESIALTVQGVPTLLYWDYNLGERYLIERVVKNNQTTTFCFTAPMDTIGGTSLVLKDTLLVKPSVLLGFEESLVPKPFDLTRVGSGRARHYHVEIFSAKFDLPDVPVLVDATYYILNQTLYPGVSINNQKPLIQIDVTARQKNGLKTDTYTYNIFTFNPNPRRSDLRQSLETPNGVYCEQRSRGFRLPENLPEQAIANTEGRLSGPSRLIISTHGLYDTEADVSRVEYRLAAVNDTYNIQHISVLHDFLNGLSYAYDYRTRECVVSDISVNSTDSSIDEDNINLIQMTTPRHFFQFDGVDFQYSGEKPCRSRFMCNVWIGKKQLPNDVTEYREWYWATSINDEPLRRWIPMQYITRTYNGDQFAGSYHTVFYNYRAGSPFGILEVDYNLAQCYRALGPANNFNLASLSFRLNNDADHPVMRNLNYLIFHAAESLIFGLRVRPIRISAIVIDKEDKDIVVTFTLLDAPPRKGPVEVFYNESSLDEAIRHLRNAIDSGNFVVRARARDRQILLHARPNSLNVAPPTTEDLTTGPRITAFWIVFIIIGLLVGIVGGLLVLNKISPK